MDMKAIPALLALILALPAAAQVVTADQSADAEAASARAAALRAKLKPAPVDPKAVDAIVEKLSKEGQQVVLEDRTIGNVLTMLAIPKEHGGIRNVQATLVELPAETVEGPAKSMYRYAVMRRYFAGLSATSEDWDVDPKTGKGTLHIWVYTVALSGTLMSVEHQTAPVEPGPDGMSRAVEEKARSYRMAPSDPSVQRRWKALTKEMAFLGRVTEA